MSLSLNSGDILGLLGPNGAGKSTLLGMLATLVAPTSGIGDLRRRKPATRAPAQIRGRIGVLAHELHLYPELTARQNLEFFARLHGLDDRTLVRPALESAGLADRGDDQVASFSRGCGSGSRSSARCCIGHGWCCSTSRSPDSTIAPSRIVAERLTRLAADGRHRRAGDARSGCGRRADHPRWPSSAAGGCCQRRGRRRRHPAAVPRAGGVSVTMFFAVALLVLKKDFAIELKSYEILSTTLFFAVSCVADLLVRVREGRGSRS